MTFYSIRSLALAAGLMLTSAAAMAHPGHGAHTLAAGLLHPLGWDHLLAVLAVGLWSVLALPAQRVWQGPVLFLLAMLGAVLLGWSGFMLPYLSHALALSVLLFGPLLWLSTQNKAPLALGLGLVALAGALHGLSHGFAVPGAGAAVYALGLVLSTAALHGAGALLGWAIRHRAAAQRRLTLGGVGAALGLAGLFLFGQQVFA